MSRARSYGHRLHQRAAQDDRFYLQSCVKSDVWAVIERLRAEHNITISGAAHHLMRLGAGLSPLPPLDSND